MRTVGLVLCLGLVGACQAQSVDFGERPDGGCVGSRCATLDVNSGNEGTSNSEGPRPAGGSNSDAGSTESHESSGEPGPSEPRPSDEQDSGVAPNGSNGPAQSAAPGESGPGDPAGSMPTAPDPNTPDPDEPGPGPGTSEPSPSSSVPAPAPSEPSPAPTGPGTGNPSPAPTSVGPSEPVPTTPTPAPTMVPVPTPPEEEVIGGCGNQLLRNGGFDRGDVEWRASSTWPGVAVILPGDDVALQRENVAPHAGTHLAWLGGIPSNRYDSHVVALEQLIVIPETASTLTFSGRVWIRTEEDNAADPAPYDVLYADLFDGPGDDAKVSWLAGSWSNLDATTGWVAFERQTTTTYLVLGREVAFQLHSRTDPELVTSFWFDSLRLVANCGR